MIFYVENDMLKVYSESQDIYYEFTDEDLLEAGIEKTPEGLEAGASFFNSVSAEWSLAAANNANQYDKVATALDGLYQAYNSK